MSVIVKDPKGRIFLFCKVGARVGAVHYLKKFHTSAASISSQGADIVIRERMDMNVAQNKRLWEPTSRHMEEYGSAGLRSLCLAYTEILPAFYEQ